MFYKTVHLFMVYCVNVRISSLLMVLNWGCVEDAVMLHSHQRLLVHHVPPSQALSSKVQILVNSLPGAFERFDI